jgi:uncharacterized protein YhbP (UPF0306 family)
LTRIKQFLSQEEVTLHDAQARLTIIEQLFKTFDEAQMLIENKKENKDDRTQDATFIAECEGTIFQQSYFIAVATGHQIIERYAQ